MFELLLYTSLTCSSARNLISKINRDENLPDHIKMELVETVKDSMQERDFCNWDAND